MIAGPYACTGLLQAVERRDPTDVDIDTEPVPDVVCRLVGYGEPSNLARLARESDVTPNETRRSSSGNVGIGVVMK